MAVHKYRVREGYTYGAYSQYGPGSIVELDDETAKHVMDKLELAEIVQNVVPPAPPPGSEDTDEGGDGSTEGASPLEPEEPSARTASRPKSKSGGD